MSQPLTLKLARKAPRTTQIAGSLLVVWGGIASAVLLILIFTVSYWVGRRIAKAP